VRIPALTLALLLVAPSLSRQADTPAGFTSETLNYRVEWRLMKAGEVRLEWKNSDGGWQTRLQLRSAGLVSALYRVDDLYLAELDGNLCALNSLLTAREGPRRRETKVTFDSERLKASYIERDLMKNTTVAATETGIPACVHDVIGGLYRLREMRLAAGSSAEIPVSDGKKSVMARVEAQQQETVETPAGRFKTIRYEAFLFNNVLYRRSGRLHVWLTDDERRLPVQIRARFQFPIGTVTLQLAKMEL
jgi:hypothetical protein